MMWGMQPPRTRGEDKIMVVVGNAAAADKMQHGAGECHHQKTYRNDGRRDTR